MRRSPGRRRTLQGKDGHYPRKVLVDKIYRTKDNRSWCRERGISMSGRGPGRPPKAGDAAARREEHGDDVASNEVERFFSREKRTCGAALVVAKLDGTTLAGIALSVLVANLFGVPLPCGGFFIVYFLDGPENTREWHFCEFSDCGEKLV